MGTGVCRSRCVITGAHSGLSSRGEEAWNETACGFKRSSSIFSCRQAPPTPLHPPTPPNPDVHSAHTHPMRCSLRAVGNCQRCESRRKQQPAVQMALERQEAALLWDFLLPAVALLRPQLALTASRSLQGRLLLSYEH